MDMKENEDRMGRTLDALEHPGRFTKEELEELLLRPGEGTDSSLDRKTVDDAEDCRAWTDGRFAFDDAPLVEIMRELGRWYNVDIVFTDREVMQERLHFRADRRDSLEQVLELLNCLRKVRARIEDGRVVGA